MKPAESTDCDGNHAAAQHGSGTSALKDVLERIEHDLILTALQESRGNKAKAARALGMTERLIGLRVKRLGIDWRGLRRRKKHSDAHITEQHP